MQRLRGCRRDDAIAGGARGGDAGEVHRAASARRRARCRVVGNRRAQRRNRHCDGTVDKEQATGSALESKQPPPTGVLKVRFCVLGAGAAASIVKVILQ